MNWTAFWAMFWTCALCLGELALIIAAMHWLVRRIDDRFGDLAAAIASVIACVLFLSAIVGLLAAGVRP